MPADRPILNDQERNGTMLKVLHGADFHLDSPFSGLKPDAAARRRGEQRELLARLTDLAREREADLVLLSGDLLDGDLVFRETVQALARALGEIPCPVFLAPGNHDWYGPQSPYAALEWPGNVHLFTGPELGAVRLPELGCTVWGAAFCAPRQSASPLRGFHAPAEGVQLAVLHGEVAAQGDYGPISEEDIAASGLDYLALGHVHQYSGLRRAGETFWAYPGCPEGRGFDELGEKGVLWLEVEKGRTEAEFVPLCRRRYQILSVDLTGQADPAAAVLAALSSRPGLEQIAGKADASLKSAAWNTGKVTAHHAIAPTGELPPDNLKPEERSLYFMIATAFCLQFHPPMRYEARKIVLNLADTRWEVTGRRMVDAGWTAFSKDEDDDRQEEESLPPVEQGDAVTCRTVESVKKKTSPPSRFSEGTLIEAMANVHRFVGDAEAKATLRETRGIGTEATRAKVLETLKERGYLALDKKSIVSTPLGREIIDLTPPALKDPITTAEWESRLEAIAQGRETLDAFLAEQKKILPELLAPILGDGRPAFPCPDCGAALNRRRRKKDGSWFWGCTAYPDCKVILPDENGKPGKARPKPALSEYACPVCGKPLVKRSGAKGEFYGCSGYPGCKKTWPVAPNGAPDFNAKKRGK